MPSVVAIAFTSLAPLRLRTSRHLDRDRGGQSGNPLNSNIRGRFLLACGCVYALSLSSWAATKGGVLELTSGLASFQVLKRDADDRAEVEFVGKVTVEGADSIEARILRRRLVMKGFDWTQVGSAHGDHWTAIIQALPVGGPHSPGTFPRDVGTRPRYTEPATCSLSKTLVWLGSDPYCNLVDEANMADPIFGSMEIESVPSEN